MLSPRKVPVAKREESRSLSRLLRISQSAFACFVYSAGTSLYFEKAAGAAAKHKAGNIAAAKHNRWQRVFSLSLSPAVLSR
jgi:hypothetical protein